MSQPCVAARSTDPPGAAQRARGGASRRLPAPPPSECAARAPAGSCQGDQGGEGPPRTPCSWGG